jgi:hypothetical protein
MAEMEVGLRGDRQAAFAAISESTETLAAVLLTALRKVDPEFPATKVWEAMPTEITAAIGVLILASCDPDALADVISIAQQVRQ